MTIDQKRDNINRYSDAVIEGTQGSTLLPSVAMAQMILETGFMNSNHIKGNNLYGIKASGKETKFWDGTYVTANTFEIINGVRKDIISKFRQYRSEADSVRDRTEFLKTNARYKNVFTETTPEGQARELQRGGYATAQNYADTLISIIKTWNLNELDKKKRL